MPKRTINRRKKQSNKKKKSIYSSISKKIDKVLDSYFKKDKKTKKRKKTIKKSGTKSGPWRRNPRVQLNIEKKELEEIAKDILENTDPLIKEAKRIEFEASKETKIVANFVKQKIANDLLESIDKLKQVEKERESKMKELKEKFDEESDKKLKQKIKENKINFLYNSLLFWKMCDNFPKTEICIGKKSKEKIEEYIGQINILENKTEKNKSLD